MAENDIERMIRSATYGREPVTAGKEVPYGDRHPATQELLMFLKPNPNLSGLARNISYANWNHALMMVDVLADGPELTAGLRKLMEAKDCFVRQCIRERLVSERYDSGVSEG